jgi:hypothetical protein
MNEKRNASAERMAEILNAYIRGGEEAAADKAFRFARGMVEVWDNPSKDQKDRISRITERLVADLKAAIADICADLKSDVSQYGFDDRTQAFLRHVVDISQYYIRHGKAATLDAINTKVDFWAKHEAQLAIILEMIEDNRPLGGDNTASSHQSPFAATSANTETNESPF